jgi:hypothetical protein
MINNFNMISKTPLPSETPYPRRGGYDSTYMKSPLVSYYGGGGTSPGFKTPIYSFSHR